MKLFKTITFITLLIYATACSHSTDQKILIDLDQKADSIYYSTFAKSLDYIELNTNDTCLISEINRIYLDDDTICILDKKGAGVFVFTTQGNLVSQINYFGEGPQEFIDITAFNIDTYSNSICILDYNSKKINKYNYKGEYIGSNNLNDFARDFTIFNNEINLYIVPFYIKGAKYGLWTEDISNNTIKNYEIEIPKDDQFELYSTYFNRYPDGIFYYDRNFDNISYITLDSLHVVYNINLKQRLKDELRKKNPSSYPWKDFAMMWNFSIADHYLLLTYYYYDQEDPYRWVLINRETKNTEVANHLINDIDNIQSESSSIFFLNKKTWCRVIESPDINNCNITLQLIETK